MGTVLYLIKMSDILMSDRLNLATGEMNAMK